MLLSLEGVLYTIRATFDVVTPMFLGGAANKETAELRVASIKGQLRFWWRTLAWGRLANLDKIRVQEAQIFGSADREVGAAKFTMRCRWIIPPLQLSPPPIRDAETPLDNTHQEQRKNLKKNHRLTIDGRKNSAAVGDGTRYLGYGLLEAFGRVQRQDPRDRNSPVMDVFVPGELSRSCLFHLSASGDTAQFQVCLTSQRPFAPDLLNALKLFGLLGGLGARTRRGWGSVALIALEGDGVESKWSTPTDAEDYGKRVKEILSISAACRSNPKYSAIFNGTRILLLLEKTTSLAALNELGDKFQLFRGWRRPGGLVPEQNFKADHDGHKVTNGTWRIGAGSFDATCPSIALRHPLRVAFGLPHNYSQRLKIEAEDHDRRASPLLFHIHPIGDQFAAIATVFPSAFLPDVTEASGARPERIKIINGRNETLIDNHIDYRIIDAFLDGFTTATGQARKYFSSPQKIL